MVVLGRGGERAVLIDANLRGPDLRAVDLRNAVKRTPVNPILTAIANKVLDGRKHQ